MSDSSSSFDSFGDYLARKVVGAVVFASVSAFCGPLVGAVAAAAVTASGDGGTDGVDAIDIGIC